MLGPLGHVGSLVAYLATARRRQASDQSCARQLAWSGSLPPGLELTWLGTAGFRLAYQGTVVWIDPYITRLSLRDLVARRVVPPSEAAIAAWIDRAAAVLVGHTHFDHALDVPAIAQRFGARGGPPRVARPAGRHAGGRRADRGREPLTPEATGGRAARCGSRASPRWRCGGRGTCIAAPGRSRTSPGRAVTGVRVGADIGREICEHPGVAEQPAEPDPERQQHLLGVLGELIARGGPDPLLAPPVVPGAEAFPERWEPTASSATTLLRRLVGHAGMTQGIAVVDELRAALVTERKPETHLEVIAIRNDEIAVRLLYIAEDDVAGTCAHEIGVAYVAITRFSGEGPYRAAERREIEVDADRDLERGSIATVYLGLGVLAANAAYQEYSRPGPTTGAWVPLEYDVLRAGYAAMSDLAYLLAVQAVVRGEATPPRGLKSVQRDEVTAWLEALRDRGPELCAALAIPADARPIAARPAVEPLAPAKVAAVAEPTPARRRAFRWQSHRGFLGFALGGVGLGIAGPVLFGAAGAAALGCFVVGAIIGHLLGRGVKIARCSACVTVVDVRAASCRKCGAVFRGDIASLAQRLEAEERLDDAGDPP